MHIGIIARGLTKGGATRFIINILSQFNEYKNHNFYLFTDRYDFSKKFINIKVVYLKRRNKLFWDLIKSFFIIRKYNLDLIIYPKNIIPLTHFFIKVKKINIIHDLAYFHPTLGAYKFWDTIYMKNFMRLSCRMANKTIAVSNNTKKDIINILKIKPQKIEVIFEAADKRFKVIIIKLEKRKKIINKYHLKIPFILYIGSLSPRKNIHRLIKAFEKVKKEKKIPHFLVLASGKTWKEKNIYKNIDKSSYKNFIILSGFVSDEDLPYLYNLADLLVFPSLYEGFGLPILEAQACGCPVLTSNITSCPEVAGDSAHLVNPYSIEEIKNGILKIIKNNNYKESLILAGHKNIKRFNWQITAEKILNLVNYYKK